MAIIERKRLQLSRSWEKVECLRHRASPLEDHDDHEDKDTEDDEEDLEVLQHILDIF